MDEISIASLPLCYLSWTIFQIYPTCGKLHAWQSSSGPENGATWLYRRL